MTTIDPQRRQQLLAKYPAMSNAWPMNPRVNTQVHAIDRAEQIIRRVWQNLAPADAVLARVPALAEWADAAAAEFHRREGEASRERALGLRPSLYYDTHDTEYDPDAMYEQGVVKVWRLGDNYVTVVRDRWHDAPNRRLTTTGYFASMVDLETSNDYRDGDCGPRCDVQLAESCTATTRLMPVDRGTLIVLLRWCWACEDVACKIAAETYETNAKIAEFEACEDWPPADGAPR
ncbi:hypothetical protein [Mycobacterium sp. pR1184]|uniref:hypothetical protein n=1 Tax=Mycobacterium sp. pR1184 TaxID=3238981 RepID=UPI00351ABECC